MAWFVTIGYGDEAGYRATALPVREAAHAHDARLLASGALIGKANQPVQVRNPDGEGIHQTPGPYLRAPLPVAGFAIIEADTIEAAVQLVADTPCAVARGVVEVWPLDRMT